MPELPEVETVVRTLAPQITGKKIAQLHILHEKSFQCPTLLHTHSIHGAVINRVFRRAKLVMLECTNDMENTPFFMAFHLKMTGRFFVHPAQSTPLRHTRLIFDLYGENAARATKTPAMQETPQETACRLFFDDMRTFGYCRVMQPHELDTWDFWKKLGPEPLETSSAILAKRFQAKRGGIKAVLLDQTVVAGIGNIYADEALFQAGIAPTVPAAEISQKRLRGLAEAVQDVLQRSINECGSSIRDYRDANGDAGSFQNHFYVYGRKGECCRVCATSLECGKAGGRTTMWCPRCQK